MNNYAANPNRYSSEVMGHRRCGRSGLILPEIALGLWHNFGSVDVYDVYKAIAYKAFDEGVFHFDLANNYGPEPGSAERNFGQILRDGLARYRDELIISTKAGYLMWPGPYGDGGSRKYLFASLEQSLQRMGLDYVDIFYHHRPDQTTDLHETMQALTDIVRQGKALYVGLSNYDATQFKEAQAILQANGTPCVLHQGRYSMLDRKWESSLLPLLQEEEVGFIAFSPLAQGMLTDRYLHGIPADSRAGKDSGYLKPEQVSPEVMVKVQQLHALALERGQSLAQMAIGWLLQKQQVTSVLLGASSVAQLDANLKSRQGASFSSEELNLIQSILEQ